MLGTRGVIAGTVTRLIAMGSINAKLHHSGEQRRICGTSLSTAFPAPCLSPFHCVVPLISCTCAGYLCILQVSTAKGSIASKAAAE